MTAATSDLAGRQYGFAIPQMFLGEQADMSLVRDVVCRAEALGFESLWGVEITLSAEAVLEPIGTLAYVAALTERARLGVSVIVSTLHNPVQLAKDLSSLDNLCGGRLIAGLGIGVMYARPGVPAEADYPAFGITKEGRISRFEESLRVMRALWSEKAPELKGRFNQLGGVQMTPKPLQAHLPVWLGGGHPNTLRRAVRMADGYMGAGGGSTADFRTQVTGLREELDAAGRDPATFPLSKRVYLHVDDDEKRAEQTLATFFKAFYGGDPELAANFAVFGSKERVAEGLAEVFDAGAGMVMLNPVAQQREQLEILAEMVGLKK